MGWGIVCLFVLSLQQLYRVSSELVAAAVIPHGDFAYDPTLLSPGTAERHAADIVAQAAREAGRVVSHADVISLSTPHGIELSTEYAIYLGSHASGYATIGADLPNSSYPSYTVKLSQIDLAPTLSENLLTSMTNESVSGILPFADKEDMALRWGEVIPLKLLKRKPGRRHLIWSHPLRRYTEASEMVPELLRLGQLIFEWAEATLLRIGIVISSDLSHSHQSNGPYGYSNASEPFDRAVGIWAKDPCNNKSFLLEKARSLQSNAKSCGFTGLVLLHGVLCGQGSASRLFDATVLANRNATYYGMMAATFERREETKMDSTSFS